MKKIVIVSCTLILFLFLVGCLDYKAYDLPAEDEDTSLINEIAQIEEELAQEQAEPETEAEEDLIEEPIAEEELDNPEDEVILPELGTEETTELQVINVKENELVDLNVKVTDPDEDVVTWSFTPPLDAEGKWKTVYGDAGEYLVTLSATDGKLTTTKELKIKVERVNVPPVIGAIADIVVNEGELVSFTPKVDDPNNDAVSVTVTEPLADGTFETDHTSAGEYQITVTANDGELTAEETFKLVINDINELPEISNLGDVQVDEGTVVEIKPAVTDLDEDEITVTISDPVGDDGVWETDFTSHGEYIVTVTVNDGKDTVVRRINVIVSDINMPPEIVDVSLATE